jgi:predicted site-specific integrase-resolvase
MTTDLPLFMNQSQAAKALGVSRTILRRHEARGHIRGTMQGNEKLYSRASVIDLAIRRNSR